jgi:hypothetical protein
MFRSERLYFTRPALRSLQTPRSMCGHHIAAF